MATTLTPVLWIGGKATSLLQPLQGKGGNTYFAPSKQATSYGMNVDSDVLPEGVNTPVSIGTDDNEGQKIPTTVDANDESSRTVRGSLAIEVAGVQMVADLMIRALPDGTFTFKPVVHRPNRRTYTASEVFKTRK